MSKIVVKPNKLQDISMLLNQNIDGIIFPIENLSVESSFFIDIDEVINLLKGIPCGNKGTSCPDQVAKALEQYKKEYGV